MNITEAKIGFGTYKVTNQELLNDIIEYAINAKYDFIDTAKVYQNEEQVGIAIKRYQDKYPNKKIPLIQSKVWTDDFNKSIEKAVKSSLQRLGLKHLDSCMLHRPHVDNSINVKAWKGLIECQKKGLVTTIGVSNFEPDMIRILFNETGVMPTFTQNEASVTYIRKDRIVHASENKIKMQAWRPMGSLLENLDSPLLRKMAKKYKCSVPQLLIAYVKGFGFTPIVKSSKKSTIEENIKALKIKISKPDLNLIESKLNTHKTTGSTKNDSYAFLNLAGTL